MEDNAAPIRRKKLPGKLLQLLQLLPGGKPTTITIIYTFVTQHVMWQKKGILSRFDQNVTKKYMLSSACEIFSMNFPHSLRSERNSTLGQNQSWGKCICGVINVFGAARKE